MILFRLLCGALTAALTGALTGALFILWAASGDGVELATLAFLVVFRVLIRLFFSIDMVIRSSLLNFLSRRRWSKVQVICQTRDGHGALWRELKTRKLRLREGWPEGQAG